MDVLFFSDRLNAADKRLLSVIKEQVPLDHLYICRHKESLKCNVGVPNGDLPVVIILAHDRYTLESIADVSEMCGDSPIILILPDRALATHNLGFQFSPCCISYTDNDLSDVGLVLAKMMMRDARVKAFQYKDENLQPQEMLELQ